MKDNILLAVIVLAIAFIACVFMYCEYNRYSIHTGTDSIAGYRIDKKTGEIFFLRGPNRYLQEEKTYNTSAVRLDDILKQP